MKTAVALVAVLLLNSIGSAAVEAVRISPDSKGFVLAESKKPFIPWGFNYGATETLLDDDWEHKWDIIERDFRAMQALGANVIRVHLQISRFMDAADRANAQSLDRLSKLIEIAERVGLYLDITGLACYRTADVPKWYDALSESERWAAQAHFWEAIASRCAKSNAIFCYDLMNEPIVPGQKRKGGDWYSGKPLGGFDFVQFITLDPAGRPREQIARDWIRTLSAAIRKHDTDHPITVGLLPWVPKWGHLSGFIPQTVSPELDFISVHIYPEKGKVPEAIEGLKKFAVGKPIVIEETFPLTCGVDDLRTFLRDSKPHACGWIGHYAGQSIDDLQSLQQSKKITIPQAMMLDWLKLFREFGPKMRDGR
jgi:hypothetical protein